MGGRGPGRQRRMPKEVELVWGGKGLCRRRRRSKEVELMWGAGLRTVALGWVARWGQRRRLGVTVGGGGARVGGVVGATTHGQETGMVVRGGGQWRLGGDGFRFCHTLYMQAGFGFWAGYPLY